MKRFIAGLFALLLIFSGMQAALAVPREPLKLENKGDDVKRLQERLRALWLLEGEADGVFGKATQSAVQAAQTYFIANGQPDLRKDGAVDQKTWKLLFDDGAAAGLLNMKSGSSGPPVKKLQKRLIELGFLDDFADGGFGEKTENALKAFQAWMAGRGVSEITESGVADAAPRAWLFRDLHGYGIEAPMFYDEIMPSALKPGYLYARACLLIDAKTGEVLFEKNADSRMYPASTTKIMTALLAIENGKPGKIVTVPKSAADIPADSSTMPVYPGEQMPFRDLVYGLLLKSGNDAANAIATLVAGDIPKFVDKMNQKAAEFGMKDTHFSNPHGYHDPEHYTTARDMSILACQALKKKTFREIVLRRAYTLSATEKRKALRIENLYDILNPESKYYYPGAFGIKTGYTGLAGYCYVGAVEKDGRTLLAVLFHSGEDKSCKWIDAARLYDYGFSK